jgi:hypothetical protein
MTSQVNPNNIDGTFPVAGQDNDSQGFRDNFTNIRNNFTFSKAEIEDLQNKVVLKSALLNTTLSNDFAGNAISNPALTSWRETYNNIGSVSGSVTINFINGNFQRITMSGSTTLNFSFPVNTANQYASIKLWVSNSNTGFTLTLPSAVTLGDPSAIAGLTGTAPPIISFSAAEIAESTDYLFEFFTVDGGTTIGIRDLTRNRDVAHSGLLVNSNLVANGDLITNAGRINTDFAYVTLTNSQNFFANTVYQTLYFDTASSATIANARIALPDSAENGREIVLSFLAPVTSVWINKGNTALVRWAPNGAVSSGNVSVKYIYSTAASNWLRS